MSTVNNTKSLEPIFKESYPKKGSSDNNTYFSKLKKKLRKNKKQDK